MPSNVSCCVSPFLILMLDIPLVSFGLQLFFFWTVSAAYFQHVKYLKLGALAVSWRKWMMWKYLHCTSLLHLHPWLGLAAHSSLDWWQKGQKLMVCKPNQKKCVALVLSVAKCITFILVHSETEREGYVDVWPGYLSSNCWWRLSRNYVLLHWLLRRLHVPRNTTMNVMAWNQIFFNYLVIFRVAEYFFILHSAALNVK